MSSHFTLFYSQGRPFNHHLLFSTFKHSSSSSYLDSWCTRSATDKSSGWFFSLQSHLLQFTSSHLFICSLYNFWGCRARVSGSTSCIEQSYWFVESQLSATVIVTDEETWCFQWPHTEWNPALCGITSPISWAMLTDDRRKWSPEASSH